MLEGEISEINLVERLVELWREQFTGAIRFENDGIIKIVYFKSGDVLSASTNDRADSIDEILMRAGKVSREHVKQALAKRKENETLGDALLNLGFITRKELTWARRVQVVGVIRSIAAWETGSFTIVADYLPKRDEGTLFPLPQILVELIVTDQDRLKVERALEGGNAVFTKASDFDAVFRRLGLNEDADAIVAEVDGEKNASEVATTSGKDAFNVYKLLHALATLGILTPVAIPQGDSQLSPQFSTDDFGGAGVADAADIWSEPPTPSLPTLELDVAEAAPRSRASSSDSYQSAPQSQPQFETSAWDEEPADDFSPQVTLDDEPSPSTIPASSRMPAWDSAPSSVAVPIPVSIEPPADAEEEQWGFDEAQIETAKRATSVPPIPPPAPSVVASGPHLRRPKAPDAGRRYGLLIALFMIAILAAGGYYGFLWWQGRQDAATTLASTTPKPAPRTTTQAPAPTGTIVETPTETAPVTDTLGTFATTTTTQPPLATTTTMQPVPAATATVAPPPVATATTASATPSNQALPPVVRRMNDSKSRYDAMARDYAANASGNFTVQVQILCETSNLDKAMRDGGERVWFVPQTIGGRSCYRVFWGRFATRDAAQQAMNDIPASLRDRSSAVKPVPKP